MNQRKEIKEMEILQIKEIETSEVRTLDEEEIRQKNAYKWIYQCAVVSCLYFLIRSFVPKGYSFVSIVLTIIVIIILFYNVNRHNAKEIKELRKNKIYRYFLKISDAITYSNLDAYVDIVAIDKSNSIFQVDTEYNKEEISRIAAGIQN